MLVFEIANLSLKDFKLDFVWQHFNVSPRDFGTYSDCLVLDL